MRFLNRLSVALVVVAFAAASSFADAKPYESRELGNEAAKVERQITQDVSTANRPAADWIKDGIAAVKKDDWRAAASAFGAAIAADPSSEQAWRNYAIALLRVTPNDEERYELPLRASAAAYKAYMLAKDAKAEARALAVVAETLVRREEWRPALNAYKESLKLNEHPEVRAAYLETREAHGFRVTDFDVESDTASPRACLEFSENLARGRVDFSPYVSVVGMEKPAVSGEGDKICVDGLKHGETYEVTIRSGVPSAVDEDTLKPYDRDHLRARPRAERPLHRPQLRAAEHRPAGHSVSSR